MTRYAFTPLPDESATDAWRPLDRALYRWVMAHGGSPLLARTAAWASCADGNGDTALPLVTATRHAMPPTTAAELAALRGEAMVGNGSAATPIPFVLDAAGHFYLWRNYQHETAVVDAIARRCRGGCEVAVDAADIDTLFHGVRSEAVEPQRRAVRSAPGRTLFVLTGGPGTGKTTTVLRMLLMLQRHAATPQTIQVAAPTGKAAQRLVQSLRNGKRDLLHHPDAPLPADWHALLQRVPDHAALTVHRLLGYQPWDNTFKRNAADPIAADIVVIDEASMIDLAMLRNLLDAIRSDATLILVGDADQLTSVAAGSVLMDLVGAMERDGADDVVRLRHSFRAERHLVTINEAVREGSAAALAVAIEAAGTHAAHVRIDDSRHLGVQLRRWAHALAAGDDTRRTLAAGHASARADDDVVAANAVAAMHDRRHANGRLALAALDALAQRQLLCALREGPFGAIAANHTLERLLKTQWGIDDDLEWYPGRPVIVTRNDYATGLFNGDVGICLADDAGRVRVWFETSGAGSAGDANASTDAGASTRAVRSFAPNALPAHEAAYAITIHKSQGSEYAHVAVLLPPDADNRILSKQLLYTGLSRAKQSIELWSAEASLATALALSVNRAGGLADKLSNG